MNKPKGSISEIIASKDSEALASYIESDGDLSELLPADRVIFAQMVRGSTGARKREMCTEIAYLVGTGMPAYTNSRNDRPSPVVEYDAHDACVVIAETRGLDPDYVRKIWAKRHDDNILKAWEAYGKYIAEMYRTGKILPPSEEERKAFKQSVCDK
jgi:hypothetical protein